jgi:hypothetical protein
MEPKLEITIEEFYQVIGELEIVRRKQAQQIQALMIQADEMSKEIERLRNPDGGLVKTDNNQ